MHVAMDHFKTSHVTVYLATSKLTTPQDRFQYISCYGLSCNQQTDNTTGQISIHLMLRFIRRRGTRPEYANCISIHLMLRFINTEITKTSFRLYFNTSHVTVYQYQMKHESGENNNFNTSHVTVYHLNLDV